MMVKLPYGYFMDEPQMFEKHSDPVKKTIDKIQKIAKQGLSTDELVIHLRQNEALSSEERQHIARITNKMGEDPFPGYDEQHRGDIAENLYEMLQLLLEQRHLEFIQAIELLSSEVKWQLYQEIERAGGDLVSLVKTLDIHTIQTQKTPITQALAQLAELAVTHGARTPYLTKKEIEQMEQDFIDMKNEEVD